MASGSLICMKAYVTVGHTTGFRPAPKAFIEAIAPITVFISVRRYFYSERINAMREWRLFITLTCMTPKGS
jgi:hypothetical protein